MARFSLLSDEKKQSSTVSEYLEPAYYLLGGLFGAYLLIFNIAEIQQMAMPLLAFLTLLGFLIFSVKISSVIIGLFLQGRARIAKDSAKRWNIFSVLLSVGLMLLFLSLFYLAFMGETFLDIMSLLLGFAPLALLVILATTIPADKLQYANRQFMGKWAESLSLSMLDFFVRVLFSFVLSSFLVGKYLFLPLVRVFSRKEDAESNSFILSLFVLYALFYVLYRLEPANLLLIVSVLMILGYFYIAFDGFLRIFGKRSQV